MTTRLEAAPPRDRTPVWKIMQLWPETIRLFLARGMACVGCPMGGMHTLQEACAVHKVALEPLLSEVTQVARTTRARFPDPG